MYTIQCKFCASPLHNNSLVCMHCKQRNPISPLYEKDISFPKIEILQCVECQTNAMKFMDFGDYEESFTALQCSDCKGIFISFELLEKGIMHYGLKRNRLPSKINAPEEKKVNKDNIYSCPMCKQKMKRFLYKISSNVIIDKCEGHGVWLNNGELKELIEWKQSFKKFNDKEKQKEAYRKYGLKKTKSPYTYQKKYNNSFENFLEWLMGV